MSSSSLLLWNKHAVVPVLVISVAVLALTTGREGRYSYYFRRYHRDGNGILSQQQQPLLLSAPVGRQQPQTHHHVGRQQPQTHHHHDDDDNLGGHDFRQHASSLLLRLSPSLSPLPMPHTRYRSNSKRGPLSLCGGGAKVTSHETPSVGTTHNHRDVQSHDQKKEKHPDRAEDEEGTVVLGGSRELSGGKLHWTENNKFASSYANTASDSMTLSRKAFDGACRELKIPEDTSSLLWLKLHEHCYLTGGEHITSGVTPPRDDARNVNAWHWDNANLMPWTQKRLQEMMVGIEVPNLPEGGWMRITGMKKCEGDCETNTRKGRVIICFDLKVVLTWEAEVNFEEGSGTISLPYIDNVETEDGNIRTEVSFQKDKNSPRAPPEVQEVVNEELVPLVRERMREFLAELNSKAVTAKQLQNKINNCEKNVPNSPLEPTNNNHHDDTRID